MTSSGVTSGGSQSHSKGERGGREEASCRAWTQKGRGIDSLLLEPGQPLPPLIEWDDITMTEDLKNGAVSLGPRSTLESKQCGTPESNVHSRS